MKMLKSLIDGVGGVIFSCLLACAVCVGILGIYIFFPLIGTGKEIRQNWKKGYMNEVRREIILFLIVWGPFYFTFLYLIYNNW